jgi:hypothetical protein
LNKALSRLVTSAGRKKNAMNNLDNKNDAADEPVEQEGKNHYTINEVAEMFNENVWTIRFWANKFKMLKPRLDKNNNILFTLEDVEKIKLISNLSKQKEITQKYVEKSINDFEESSLL